MAKAGRTSPVLIVFLVLFILATIILGVTTYLGFDGQAALAQEAKKANDATKSMQGNYRWFQFLALTYKSYGGTPLTKEEQEDIAALRKEFDGGTLQTASSDKSKGENEKIVKALDQNPDFGWNQAEKKAARTWSDQVAALKTKLDETTKNWETTKNDLEKSRAVAASSQKDLDAARAAYKKNLDEAATNFKNELGKFTSTIDELQASIATKTKESEGLKNDLDVLKAETAKKVASADKEVKAANLRAEKYAEKVPTVNILDYDQPKGHIYSMDRTGGMPFIDLGSADNVQPQLTFSIYGVSAGGKPIVYDVVDARGNAIFGSDGKPEKEGKGTLEVVKVLGAHLSQCRITHLRDANHDPVLPGDLLFNPAWNPNQHKHVAITGLIDLDGDGREDMAEFLRFLERQGVVVDAYLDPHDLTVKGRGIDINTDLLIVGDDPAELPPGKEEDPRAKRRNDFIEAKTKMQDQAIKKGVSLISLHKFLAMTGYRVPRTAVSSDMTRYGNAAGGGAEAPKGEAAPK